MPDDNFYSNLANFGFAMAAAGSQPGATLAGSFGQGGMAMNQMANQRAQANLAQQQAESAQVANQMSKVRLGMMQNMGKPVEGPADAYGDQDPATLDPQTKYNLAYTNAHNYAQAQANGIVSKQIALGSSNITPASEVYDKTMSSLNKDGMAIYDPLRKESVPNPYNKNVNPALAGAVSGADAGGKARNENITLPKGAVAISMVGGAPVFKGANGEIITTGPEQTATVVPPAVQLAGGAPTGTKTVGTVPPPSGGPQVQPPATTTTTAPPKNPGTVVQGRTPEDIAANKSLVDEWFNGTKELNEQASENKTLSARVDQAYNALGAPGTQQWRSGAMADPTKAVVRQLMGVADTLGIQDPDLEAKLSSQQTFHATSLQILAAFAHETNSRMAAQEFQRLLEAKPGEDLEYATNRRLLHGIGGLADYQGAMANIVSQARDQNIKAIRRGDENAQSFGSTVAGYNDPKSPNYIGVTPFVINRMSPEEQTATFKTMPRDDKIALQSQRAALQKLGYKMNF